MHLFLEEMDRDRPDGADYRSGPDYASAGHCVVETEHIIDENRRIDLVLRFGPSGDHWVGIENKPWAGEQKDQLKDYAAYVHKRDCRAAILYLSGNGRPSETLPAEKMSRYRVVPYREAGTGPSVEHWVQRCMEKCEADKVRWFLNDILDYIRMMFLTAEMVEEENGDE